MKSSENKTNKKTSVKRLSSAGKRISFPEVGQSNDENNGTNAGKKFQEATKTIMRRRSRYEKQINAMWELFSEYTESSSLHGVKYVGQKKRHWTERSDIPNNINWSKTNVSTNFSTWWAFAFILSLSICGKLIYDTFWKWERFPVIVTFAEQSTRIWDVPFPAVTLCPQIKAKQTVFNYTKYFNTYQKNWSKVEEIHSSQLALLKSAGQICKTIPSGLLKLGPLTTDKEIYTNLKIMAPQVQEIMYHCEFNGHKTTICSKWFKEIWTEEGLCYTFNMLNASELYRQNNLSKDYPMTKHDMNGKHWNVNSDYKKTKNISEDKVYPYRVFGASDGLLISLKVFEKDLDYLCGGSVDGFKLLLHPPNEIPQMSKYFYRVPMKQEVIFSVKPIFMDTSDTLRNYNSKRRQCYFESERHLAFFKTYTQRNCEFECFANYTIAKCQCSPFFMPRNSSTPICGLGRYSCHKNSKLRKFASGQYSACGCLPSCSSLSYDVELSLAKFRLQKYYQAKKMNFTDHDVTRIFISFKDNQFFASRRSELYGKTDFLANCGGLLGLFMGFSFLSIVEAVYFCTLRLACNLRRRHARKKQRLALMSESFHTDERF